MTSACGRPKTSSCAVKLAYGTNCELSAGGKYAPWSRWLPYETRSFDGDDVWLFKPDSIKSPSRIIYWTEVTYCQPYFATVNWPFHNPYSSHANAPKDMPCHVGKSTAAYIDGHVSLHKQQFIIDKVRAYSYWNQTPPCADPEG